MGEGVKLNGVVFVSDDLFAWGGSPWGDLVIRKPAWCVVCGEKIEPGTKAYRPLKESGRTQRWQRLCLACLDSARESELPTPPPSRLEFRPEVSESSPCVRGTWVTAARVVGLVVDGWSWHDILKAHPELCMDDIRACLGHVVDEKGEG